MGSNKREQERLSTRNFLDYVVLADDGTPVSRGLGRTLNVSSSGLLMETADRVALGQTLLVTLGLGEEMVEVSGRVTRSAPSTAELYATGVEFAPVDDDRQALLDHYLHAYQEASQGHA